MKSNTNETKIVPQVGSELRIKNNGDIVIDNPELELAREEEAEVVIQVNGKLRGRVNVAFGTPREALEKLALADSKVQLLLDGKQVLKVIVVPDKLVNIVVK